MSIFLMGCFDPSSQKWCTVTKCAGGHDDATLARLQTELDMVKISKVRGALASGPAVTSETSSVVGRGGEAVGLVCLSPQKRAAACIGAVLDPQIL